MNKTYTAEQIAGTPELYNNLYRFGRSKVLWECIGYGKRYRTKMRVGFFRIDLSKGRLRTVTKYVDPDCTVILDTVIT